MTQATEHKIPTYRQRQVNRNVFRAYDIRGIIDDELDANAFYSIGKAISYRLHTLKRSQLFLARDGRLSSENLANALKQGLLDSGITVLDLGVIPTPIMYYATHVGNVDSGLMVTGSHNPANYNGIKIVLAGKTLAQADIELLYDLVLSGIAIDGIGHNRTVNIVNDYTDRILADTKLQRSLSVVIDCGNGVAGSIIPNIMRAMGCNVIELYCDIDGNFPNHHPDPSVETNLNDLRAAVMMNQADIGLAFDGDGDRLGVVTNTGEVIWPDRLMMLYIQQILAQHPGRTIVCDVKCSSHLADVVRNAGGRMIMCPTGHSIVKRVMREEHAIFAGEMSGHLFFNDRWYGFDDALYSACRLLEILSQSSETASEQFARIPNSVNTPEIKIPIADTEKFIFMQRFSEQAHFPDAHLLAIDGLRVEFGHGWGLLRASNTTACLIARFEAKDLESLQTIQLLFRLQLQALDKNLTIPF